ncbi:MAG TPA: aldo/keto reductase, partial [Polyangiaceae bacterium]|nr:aldo/keto reductase [Polyangiaceae bacterium]
GEEGRYYVFSAAELRRTLGEPAATHFAAYYGVTEEGNFEGKNVLTLRRSLEQVARELGIEPGRLAESVSHSRQLVLDHRSGRVPPNVDDKVLTAWNGLTIRALSLGAWVLGDQRYLESARRASRYLLAHHRDESGRLLRGSRSGQARGPAFLEDYAALTDGLLSLYEAAGGDEFLSSARELAESMLREFSSEAAGALEHVATDQRRLIAHPKPGSDGALPSPNALAARALARLGAHGLGERYRQRAVDIVRSYGSALRREPRAHTTLLAVVDFLLEPTWELSFCGSFDADEFDELERVVATRYLPNRVVARADDQGESASPLARGKTLLDGEPTAYVCRDHVCSRPTNQAGDWQRELDALDARRRASASRELGRERLPGRATAAGTARFRERHSLDGAAHDSAFFRHDQLTISRLAFGGYRVGLDLPAHRDALALALRSCSNYFDTSPAFAWGDSERLLGEELAAAIRRGDTARDEIVVASKLGVALGVEAEELERRRQSGASPLFTVSLDSGQPWPEGAFSLDPEFLVTQLDGSLERLGLETLDVCLIQSPEHLLLAGVATTELESALSGAFALLERERQRGRVGAYGVLTNGQREELEPERLVALARSVGGAEHGLRWLALPVNAAEHDALLGQPSRLERAAALGLAVVALRPLSSLTRGALLRLVDSPVGEGDDQRLSAARYKVASLEAEFDTTL